MPNIKKKKIKPQLQSLKGVEERQPAYGCNCTNAIAPCPLDGNCLVDSLVYKAEVIDENENTMT